MKHARFALALSLLLGAASFAQDRPAGVSADTPLEARIVTSVSKDGADPWTTENRVTTVLGKSVVVRIVGSNVLIEAEFALFYSKGKGYYLMAKSTAWVQGDKGAVEAVTTLKTLPADLSKRLYFYPLGMKGSSPNRQIEMVIEIAPSPGSGG